jgi:hypothetical protein
MLPTKFRFIWPSGFRGDFLKSGNQKQELPVVAMFVCVLFSSPGELLPSVVRRPLTFHILIFSSETPSAK